MKWIEASLESFGDGKAIEQFNYELKRVIENCQDINTNADHVRSVILEVKIKPSNDRKRADVTFQAKSKLAPDAAGVDQILFSKQGAYVNSARQLTFEEYGDKVADIDSATETEEVSND